MTWHEAQQRGVVLHVTSQGTINLRSGTLTKTELETLRGQRAHIIAEWLWFLETIPNALVWDETIATWILHYATW